MACQLCGQMHSWRFRPPRRSRSRCRLPCLPQNRADAPEFGEADGLNRKLVNVEHFILHVDNHGRVTLPSWWRKREGVNRSTDLCVTATDEGSLVVETREQGLHRARNLLRKYIPEGVNLSDELIAERRAEAPRECEQPQ